MRKVLAVVAFWNLFCCGHAVAQSENLKMEELKTKKVGSSLVIEPAPVKLAVLLSPEPSETFKPVPFKKGPVKGVIRRMALLKDGSLALATSLGGYLVASDGAMQAVGVDKDCQAVANSPNGEIAFGFVLQKTFWLTDVRGRPEFQKEVRGVVVEIHIVGPKPKAIMMGQEKRPFGGSFSGLAYNKDGTMLAAVISPEGLTLIKNDKAWRNPDHDSNKGGGLLEFNPMDGNELLYANYLFRLGGNGSLSWTYIGGYRDNSPSSLYGSKGEVISIKKNWQRHLHLYEGDVEHSFRRGEEPRYLGADRMAVGGNFVAYTALDTVMVWSRQKRKVVSIFRQAPDADWNWSDYYVQAMAFRHTGELIVATSNGEVSEWNPETGKKTKMLIPPR